ncbi:MAG: bifunctional phosphopantothenoylcysteine decarboxylase/phosphopantothenate--cysteine ligase CoaBC [Streptosporangiales bacterium]|nr:bifunctional phosphopantothenoylcysteine decarboxylase/phosphopantothenate--cysteine ligase CoaBC [Streptosporangiales bacterium]
MSADDARPRVVVGVAGGIAAFKACTLVRLFTESGHDVRVVPTESALRFVGAATWEALSGHPVHTDVWADVPDVPHVRFGQDADLVVVAPATANTLARAAHGLADDLLTNTLLTARCPVVFAPAMHSEMWQHPATAANVELLRSRGALVLEPASGRLTGSDSGPGRLVEPEQIFTAAKAVLDRGTAATDLTGRRVLVTAGGTREPLDPVRFIGNRSSGRQGYAFAQTAWARGAEVILVTANSGLPDPAGVEVVRVETTEEMRAVVVDRTAAVDAVVMAAAPADFRPVEVAGRKIKKSESDGPAPVRLEQTADILAEIGHGPYRSRQVIVGFAAETDDAVANGQQKLARKGCDLLVVNEVGAGKGFAVEHNTATVLGADGSKTTLPRQRKTALADRVWDLVVERLVGRADGTR